MGLFRRVHRRAVYQTYTTYREPSGAGDAVSWSPVEQLQKWLDNPQIGIISVQEISTVVAISGDKTTFLVVYEFVA